MSLLGIAYNIIYQQMFCFVLSPSTYSIDSLFGRTKITWLKTVVTVLSLRLSLAIPSRTRVQNLFCLSDTINKNIILLKGRKKEDRYFWLTIFVSVCIFVVSFHRDPSLSSCFTFSEHSSFIFLVFIPFYLHLCCVVSRIQKLYVLVYEMWQWVENNVSEGPLYARANRSREKEGASWKEAM